MNGLAFSWARVWGLVRKEAIQLKRDRMTFAMLLGIPFMQLLLFGFAINADPHNLPTALIQADNSVFARSALKALENTGYFEFTHQIQSREEADYLLTTGEVLFVITIPQDFGRDIVRGGRPALLIEADATDPIATGSALGSAAAAVTSGLRHDLKGPLQYLAQPDRFSNRPPDPVEIRLHRRYNPENITQYNTVPGLIGVILTMTLVVITSMSLTRERERGTLENLFVLPIRPIEVMIGKIVPFIFGAYGQVILILIAARLLFQIPIAGSVALVFIGLLPFIATNLAIGFTFSTIARTQLQAVQMAMFFFLPSILLSGFMFPFAGMPGWAQVMGQGLPLTHFLRIVRSVLLKDATALEIWPNVWPLLIILSIVSLVAMRRYRSTLD